MVLMIKLRMYVVIRPGDSMKTRELIRLIQERNHATSAYQVAQLFDVMPPVAYHWAKGTRTMSDDFLPRAAELAGLPLAQVACWIAAERSTKAEVRRAFERAAAAVAGFAIVAVNLTIPMSEMPPLQALRQGILCQMARVRRFLDANGLKFLAWLPLHPATTTRTWTWGGA